MANIPTSDSEMVIWLHDKARSTGNSYFREVADRFNELSKFKKEIEETQKLAYHIAQQG